jgi:putative FmdB family regulatory protein
MPIYEYSCSACGAHIEKIQRFSDPALTDCPECGAPGTLHKLISQSNFHLKGAGWYVTDYKGKNPGANGNGNGDGHENGSDNGAEAKAAGETKSDSKTESKTETKSESKPESKPAAKSDSSASGA